MAQAFDPQLELVGAWSIPQRILALAVVDASLA